MSIFGGLRSRSISSAAFQLPERFKGTIVEKWAKYWKQLVIDYKDMVVDTGKHMKDHPTKTTIYGVVGGATYAATKNNPSLEDFRDQFLLKSNELILVSEACQNPVAKEHIRQIERWYNNGVIRRLSLGFISFIWIDNFHENSGLYKANCEYLAPQYLTFNQRVIDVGFWNKYWVLEDKMRDYDVNF